MRAGTKLLFVVLIISLMTAVAAAQCPDRIPPGTVIPDTLSLSSTSGTLRAELKMRHSVDFGGYTHYCYNYATDQGDIESPTLRLNPGDQLVLDLKNRIQTDESDTMTGMSGMDMSGAPGTTCGDTGNVTISSTNVHFHGMNIPPVCHQDNVITTLIQPGSKGFRYSFKVPANQPPGLYWYHPHIHGFTEFQVNGGATGALVVEGMDKLRPEVKGLTERIFLLRQQFLVPWIPGPYQLSINYEVADFPNFPSPVINMKPNEKQFWRVANTTNQDFTPLQFWFNGVPQKMLLIALDGYPLAQPRMETTILVPPAGRAEFIVQAPPNDGTQASFVTLDYDTGIAGNPDLEKILGNVRLTTDNDSKVASKPSENAQPKPIEQLKFAGLQNAKVTKTRKLFFSEKFGGTGGPIEFYLTLDGHKPKIFEPNEKPVITTHVGAVEDWTIENRALETHAFHMHQIHFLLLEVDGKPVKPVDLRDTIEVPFWEGSGHPFHSVKVRMDFRDPTTAGTFVFHCHILLHEDLGMMHKILVKRQD